MAPVNSLINRISDYLENRQKTNNFGTCKRCLKNVYWSTTKVASHIRSGHCSGTTEDEVKRFKNEFIYDSPKNLVHKSSVGSKSDKSKTKESETTTSCIQVINFKKEDNNTSSGLVHKVKRAKLENNESSGEEHLLEDQTDTSELIYEMEASGGGEDTADEEFYYVTEAPVAYDKGTSKSSSSRLESNKCESSPQAAAGGGVAANKEEKFISVVYPQFKGRSKMQLIDEILDLKRRNELLQVKVKTYENTINKLI